MAAPAEKRGEGNGLRMESVSFAYNHAPVLTDIDLEVRQGEFLTLLGPSGSGKTTLLRLLAGMEFPTSGRILCNGVQVNRPGADRGMVFQSYMLFPWMTLRENIDLAVKHTGSHLSRRERYALAEEYLGLVGLAQNTAQYPFELSGGMQQRGAIARVLALGSPFLLMDEPFGALDPVNRIRLQDLLISVWEHASPPRTVVFVTHDVDEALYLGDRVVVLGAAPGRVIAEIPVDFPRPRSRQTYLAAQRINELRNEIVEYYRNDVFDQMELEQKVKGSGEGI
jgi:NitT/TauT family transport system ATP-binding protein